MPLSKQEQWANDAQVVMDGQAVEIEHLRKQVQNERERCAQIAEHLSGWGNLAVQQSGLAAHIAKTIRNQA